MIRFAKPTDERDWNKVDVRIRRILIPHIDHLFYLYNFPSLLITSVYRPDGTHASWRMVDVYRPAGMTMERGLQIANAINETYFYGYRQSDGVLLVPCLFGSLDSKGKHDDHFHLQVPPPWRDNTHKLDLREMVK